MNGGNLAMRNLRICAFVVFFVAALGGDAQSQQAPSQSGQQQPVQEQRGSDRFPIIVKVLPVEKPQDEINSEIVKQASDRQIVKLTSDLASYTEWLFVATAFLGLVTAGLVFVGFLQVRDAKTSIAAAVKSARAAEKAANAAVEQTAIIAAQTKVITSDHELQQMQYIVQNKPRLRIRSIAIQRPSPDATYIFADDKIISGNLVVANIGATAAVIKESKYRFYWDNLDLPMLPPLEGPETTSLQGGIGEITIEGFGSRAFPVESKAVLDGGIADYVVEGSSWNLYIMGFIRYADLNGKECSMGFCRQYIPPARRPSDGRFQAVDHPDYEYED